MCVHTHALALSGVGVCIYPLSCVVSYAMSELLYRTKWKFCIVITQCHGGILMDSMGNFCFTHAISRHVTCLYYVYPCVNLKECQERAVGPLQTLKDLVYQKYWAHMFFWTDDTYKVKMVASWPALCIKCEVNKPCFSSSFLLMQNRKQKSEAWRAALWMAGQKASLPLVNTTRNENKEQPGLHCNFNYTIQNSVGFPPI